MATATTKPAVTRVVEPAEITLVLTEEECNILNGLLGHALSTEYGGTPEVVAIHHAISGHATQSSWNYKVVDDSNHVVPIYKVVKK